MPKGKSAQEPLLDVEKGGGFDGDQGISSFLAEAYDLLKLALPFFISSISWVGMKTTDTALLGHTGTKYLSASALSDIWTQATGVFIQGGVLSTFCSQAIGAGNKKLAGIWLQVSLFVLFLVSLPVIALWAVTYPVLRLFGEPEEISHNAAFYALVLMSCIPVRIVASQVKQFLSSQRILHPSVVTSSCGLLVNLAAGVFFVIGIGGYGGYGFKACPIVTASTEISMVTILVVVYICIQKLHVNCWPDNSWSWKNITWDRVKKFLHLYVPAALSIASDFWRVAAIGVVAATLGDVDLAVFNSSYRILWMCLILIGSFAGALSIKLGTAFGAGKVRTAKETAAVATIVTVATLAGLSVLVVSFPRYLAAIFSSDLEIQDRFEDIRFPLAAMMFLMNFSVFLERIPSVMGRTKLVLAAGLLGSWGGQVPGVLICTQYWRKDLVGLYTGCAIGYGFLCIFLATAIAMTNWKKVCEEAQKRSEKS